MRPFTIGVMTVVLAVMGCARPTPAPKGPPSAPVAPPAPAISGLPASLTLKQRTTTVIPGSKDELSLTADDITDGQVMVSLIRKGGSVLLGPRSMQTSDVDSFRFGEADYSLKLVKLNNALIGEDFASFVISDTSSKALTEAEKIERLISAVESMSGAGFVRNDQDHAAQDAARHLRQKREAAGEKIKTATEFIDQVASKSSITSEEYTIRYADGRTVPAGKVLREELAKLEAAR